MNTITVTIMIVTLAFIPMDDIDLFIPTAHLCAELEFKKERFWSAVKVFSHSSAGKKCSESDSNNMIVCIFIITVVVWTYFQSEWTTFFIWLRKLPMINHWDTQDCLFAPNRDEITAKTFRMKWKWKQIFQSIFFGVLYNKHDKPQQTIFCRMLRSQRFFAGELGILQAKKVKGIFQNNCAFLNSFNKNLTKSFRSSQTAIWLNRTQLALGCAILLHVWYALCCSISFLFCFLHSNTSTAKLVSVLLPCLLEIWVFKNDWVFDRTDK